MNKVQVKETIRVLDIVDNNLCKVINLFRDNEDMLKEHDEDFNLFFDDSIEHIQDKLKAIQDYKKIYRRKLSVMEGDERLHEIHN